MLSQPQSDLSNKQSPPGSASSSPTRSASTASNSSSYSGDKKEEEVETSFKPSDLYDSPEVTSQPPLAHPCAAVVPPVSPKLISHISGQLASGKAQLPLLPLLTPNRPSGRSPIESVGSDASDHSRSSTPRASEAQPSHRPMSPSTSIDRSSGTSTPTLSRAISISSVFSRSQSQHRDSVFGQSFLERVGSEVKELTRVSKDAVKEVAKAPAAQAGKKKFLANLQAISEPMKSSWRSSKEEMDSSSSIISSMSSDFNGLADKTSSMLSGLFGRQTQSQSQTQSKKEIKRDPPLPAMKAPPQPFGPFPQKGRRGLVERSSLIRHSSGTPQPGVRERAEATKSSGSHRYVLYCFVSAFGINAN